MDATGRCKCGGKCIDALQMCKLLNGNSPKCDLERMRLEERKVCTLNCAMPEFPVCSVNCAAAFDACMAKADTSVDKRQCAGNVSGVWVSEKTCEAKCIFFSKDMEAPATNPQTQPVPPSPEPECVGSSCDVDGGRRLQDERVIVDSESKCKEAMGNSGEFRSHNESFEEVCMNYVGACVKKLEENGGDPWDQCKQASNGHINAYLDRKLFNNVGGCMYFPHYGAKYNSRTSSHYQKEKGKEKSSGKCINGFTKKKKKKKKKSTLR
eukprot:Platyproteum_vivax@DN7032_c0_g2_i1.p1